jgi:serine/threonine protein kinase
MTQDHVNRIFHESYVLEKVIGKGASALVYQVRHRASGQSFACKIVQSDNKMNDTKTMQLESLIMKKLDHKHVVGVHALYETRDTVWMVMDLAYGGLLQGLRTLPVYNEATIAKLFRQMLLGVQYLHSKGIVHRDLKMDNVLYVPADGVDDNCCPLNIQITDFGLSAVTLKREGDVAMHSKHLQVLTEIWGTTEYMAPEIYGRAYGYQADVWSLGCLLFEMLTGELAFPYQQPTLSMASRVWRRATKAPKHHFETTAGWKMLSCGAQSLVRAMLKSNPRSRADLDECLQHPWLLAGCGETATTAEERCNSPELFRELPGVAEAIRLRHEQKQRRLAVQTRLGAVNHNSNLNITQNLNKVQPVTSKLNQSSSRSASVDHSTVTSKSSVATSTDQ